MKRDYDDPRRWILTKEQLRQLGFVPIAENKADVCKWQFNAEDTWGSGHWYAGCGLEWEFEASGTPKQHEMNYCPKCGKQIENIELSEDAHAE